MVSTIITVLLFVLIIGVVVTIHEVGHYAAARLSGMLVEEFSFGFGPKLVSKKWGDTEYMIKLFPLGGYVKILGEEMEIKDKRSFSEKSIISRMFVAVAGVLMNFLLAVVLFYIVLGARGFSYEGIPYYENLNLWFGDQEEFYAYNVTVIGITDDGGADKAGLEEPFEILGVDGNPVESVKDLKDELEGKEEKTVDLTIYKDGEEKDVEVVENKEGLIGVELASDFKLIRVEYNGVERIFAGFLHFANMTKANIFVFGRLISKSVEEKSVKPVATSVSGPIGLFVVIDLVREFAGTVGILDLIATLNLTLVIINILPFPALDGGHVLFMTIEAVRGKPVNKNVERWLVNIGMIIMFGLMILISAKDVFQFEVFDWIKGLFVG
ncbi:site-2 protease family protein [Candidatus Dojkabacteria bacterium]|nr:site-2 protease family protein [Candidatus Dojkabacteria bacterium]